MDNVAFDYRLVDDSRAQVRFRVGMESTELTVSHVGDPLDHLIAVVLAVAEGQDRAQVSWQAKDDDRQWWSHIVWLFDRESDEVVVVHVTKAHRGGGGQQGGTQLDGECSVLALCTAIAEGVNALYLRIGIRRYTELTQAPFPVDGLDRLEAIARKRTARKG